MNSKEIKEELINIVKEDSTKAIGCTEPVAVAYAANVCSQYLEKSDICKIDLEVSRNIYKNGKAVKIPTTKAAGLDLAASLGAFSKKCDQPLLVFSNLTEEEIKKAKDFVDKNLVSVKYLEDVSDLYIGVKIFTKEESARVIISDSHTHIDQIWKNDELIFEDPIKDTGKSAFSIKNMSFEELSKIVKEMDLADIYFVLEGVDVNLAAAKEGLKGYGLNLGKKLSTLKDNGILPDNFVTQTRILTAAAADMRMGGGPLPIMTSGGSGNQGIGIIIPIYMVYQYENLSFDTLARGLFFAHVINRYVKEYSGKLSGMCGCAIGAAIGASAAIAFMLGGDEKQIAGACTNVFANLTGMICDGAKESCSMKLSTSAEESIIAAYLSLNGIITDKNVGIVGESIEDTISNIGKLSHEGFSKADDVMLEIINNEKR